MWICSQHWNPRHIRWLKTDSVVWLCRGFRSALRFFHDLIMTISSRKSENDRHKRMKSTNLQDATTCTIMCNCNRMFFLNTNWEWYLGLSVLSLAFESWIRIQHPAALSQSKNSTIPGELTTIAASGNQRGSMWAGLTDSILTCYTPEI